MRADVRARAKIGIRVNVLKRAEHCEYKSQKEMATRSRKHSLTHAHLVVEKTSLNAMRRKTRVKLRKEGHSIHEKMKILTSKRGVERKGSTKEYKIQPRREVQKGIN